jgi:hypothetical protein
MNYLPPTKFVNYNDYEFIVSIGNKCPTAISLSELNIYKHSFPFDYIPTTPYLILKYLQNQNDYYPEKDIVRTNDNVWFGHFDINENYDETITTFKRRFERLFDILTSKKKILFVYTSEADVYNEMNNRYNDNYNDIIQLRDYIIDTYNNNNNFTILAIHTNKSYEDIPNIINYTINVDDQYLSDNKETHLPSIFNIYRSVLESLVKNIFNL